MHSVTNHQTVFYAKTSKDFLLPIIDITLDSFQQKELTEEEELELLKQFQQYQKAKEEFSSSELGKKLEESTSGFLPGMETYFLKLGPHHLKQFSGAVDKIVASSLPSISLRLRLSDMAFLQKERLEKLLLENEEKNLHIVNIAGGTCLDSLNLLRILSKKSLEGRVINIHLLDRDENGPHFAKNALEAWKEKGAPFEGLNIELKEIRYDWHKTSDLTSLLENFSKERDIVVGSSEGGLFEYGSDEDILANLKILHPYLSIFVGSVIREDRKELAAGVPVKPRNLDAFRELVLSAGWEIDSVTTRPLSFNVRLVKVQDQSD